MIIILISIIGLYPNILFFFWNNTKARIISIELATNPINTRYQGTLVGIKATISYEYYLNEKSYLGTDIINRRVEYINEFHFRENDMIDIIYNPKMIESSKIVKPIQTSLIVLLILGILISLIPLIPLIQRKQRNRTIAST